MRYQTLQLARAVAAILVVAFHASSTIFESPRFWASAPFHGYFDFGYSSVYFFFVLSGFIIMSAHHRDISKPAALPNYAVRRVIRIYPMYWIVVVPLALLYLVKPALGNAKLTTHDVIFNSFLLIGPTTHAALPVAWTLFHEVAFYLFFCLLILNKRIGSIAIALWWTLCALSLATSYPLSDFYMLRPENLLFAGGVAVYFLTRSLPTRLGIPLVLAGCALYLGVGWYATQTLHANAPFEWYALASILILAGLIGTEQLRPIPIGAFLLLLGDASYCIYLCHYPVLSVVARLWLKLFGHAHPDLSFLGVTIATLIPGILLHLFVEKPLLRILQTKWKNRSRPQLTSKAA